MPALWCALMTLFASLRQDILKNNAQSAASLAAAVTTMSEGIVAMNYQMLQTMVQGAVSPGLHSDLVKVAHDVTSVANALAEVRQQLAALQGEVKRAENSSQNAGGVSTALPVMHLQDDDGTSAARVAQMPPMPQTMPSLPSMVMPGMRMPSSSNGLGQQETAKGTQIYRLILYV